jgi:hypothetical protein
MVVAGVPIEGDRVVPVWRKKKRSGGQRAEEKKMNRFVLPVAVVGNYAPTS